MANETNNDYLELQDENDNKVLFEEEYPNNQVSQNNNNSYGDHQVLPSENQDIPYEYSQYESMGDEMSNSDSTNSALDINDTEIFDHLAEGSTQTNRAEDYIEENPREKIDFPDDLSDQIEDSEVLDSLPNGPILTEKERFEFRDLIKELQEERDISKDIVEEDHLDSGEKFNTSKNKEEPNVSNLNTNEIDEKQETIQENLDEDKSEISKGNSKVQYITMRNMEDKVPEIIKDEKRAELFLDELREKVENHKGVNVIDVVTLGNTVKNSTTYDSSMEKYLNPGMELNPDKSSSVNISSEEDIENKENLSSSGKEKDADEKRKNKNGQSQDYGQGQEGRMGPGAKPNDPSVMSNNIANGMKGVSGGLVGGTFGVLGMGARAIGGRIAPLFQGKEGIETVDQTASPEYDRESKKSFVKDLDERTENLREMLVDYKEKGGNDLKKRHQITKEMDAIGSALDSEDAINDPENHEDGVKGMKKFRNRLAETKENVDELSKNEKLDSDKSKDFSDKANDALEKLRKAIREMMKKIKNALGANKGNESPSPNM